MVYSATEARRQLLDTLAEATDELGLALACLSEAYERLDDHNADRLEQTFFRPVQLAYGRARRTHSGFAERHRLPGRGFEQPSAGVSSSGAPGYIERAVEAVAEADLTLVSLQDSMLPVEAGDAELRSGLAAVRDLLDGLAGQARELSRTLGR
jgi:hypothetical protein